MSLLNKLTDSKLGLKGSTPIKRSGAQKGSTLHNQSSINSQPEIPQSPSGLDLNGLTPDKYLDNLPQ